MAHTGCFDGSELWGAEADPTVTVSVDAFEPYLERRHDIARDALNAVPGIPSDSDGPVIPQAVGGTGVRDDACLHEHGVFTRSEWATALAAEIKRAQTLAALLLREADRKSTVAYGGASSPLGPPHPAKRPPVPGLDDKAALVRHPGFVSKQESLNGPAYSSC